ncbi:MAG: WYL domain-containing protein [Patescibacteria group bacterium]|nr:WYL domain-containing protein [Patescibacteria group bacterium]MDD5164056.1 WYL domain-containing protein [Patescibacteria group bacterium]MDD5534860.1 WYL domain-containing protein [Patescibacteria group bacterium]
MYSIIETIKQAASKRKILKIIYREKDGTSEGWRYIEPYSFSHDDGEDGLFAWDISKGGIRRFSFDRINDIQLTDETYNPRYGIEI